MSTRRRRKRVQPTDDWEELLPLFLWPEQEGYETIRPLVLFGDPVAERAERTGVPERTLYRTTERFEAEEMESLFAAEPAKQRRLPPAVRRPQGGVPCLQPGRDSEDLLRRLRQEAFLWLQEESLTVEYRGQPLSRYDVGVVEGSGELRTVARPRLFETSHAPPQLRLFGLDALGEAGWLKALKLDGYAPRRRRRAEALQQVLFAYTEAI